MITAIVLTKNEENNIKACLESLSWCEEVIVIDDNSTDKTIEIAQKMSAKVYRHELRDDFAQQRNFGLAKAKNNWVLFIDADERVSSALWYEIMQYINDPLTTYSGFYLKRKDTIWGKELQHGETGNINLLRIARKDAGKWEGRVHEVWKLKGKTMLLKNPLDHYPHQSVESFLREINYYTDIRAKELFTKKVQVHWWDILLYPKVKFFINYFIKRGYLDGLQGLVFALMMSFHSFLVRGKLWLLWQK